MKLKRIYLLLQIVGLSLVFSCGFSSITFGEAYLPQTDLDSLRVAGMVSEGRQFIEIGKIDTAIVILQKILELAASRELPLEEAEANYLLARISDNLDKWDLALRYYLKAAGLFVKIESPDRVAEIYSLISVKYQDLGVYDKSVEYGLLEYSLIDSDNSLQLTLTANRVALSYYLNNQYPFAINWYDSSYIYSEAAGSQLEMLSSLYGSARSYSGLTEYAKEREYLQRLAVLEIERGEISKVADIYNSLGVIDFKESEFNSAIENFKKAVEQFRKSGEGAEDPLANLAVCYQNLGNMKLADFYFEEALSESKRSGNRFDQARLEHILAVLSLNNEDLYHASYYSQSSIESALISGNYGVLQNSYETYSEVLKEGNDFIRALEYYQRYLNLRDSLAMESKLAEQEVEQRRFEIGSYEQQLRLGMASEEIKDLALKNLRVEAEKRENDFKLIERERELERSEKERLQQSLDLDRERYNRVLQQKEISDLEQEKAVQQLELIQSENAERELLREKRLLESESRQKELELANEFESKKRIKWMVVLMGIIALTILLYLISSRRKNQVLTARKREIEIINNDLEQKNEEVLVQNRHILEQSEIIEEKNQSITDSIEYASRIQSAVLPPLSFLSEWNLDNFVMFRPKDIVSGDFYWGQERGDLLCFAVADCTGHGVPGAFMSMLGIAYLNDIVNSREFNNAADILNMLREEVIQALKQKGLEGETQDGMDISLCVFDRRKSIVHYAGANNPLYIVQENQFNKIDADKMPIGIHRFLDKPFNNKTIKVGKGDVIYLFSDGYADQFGGRDGKKFKYKAFREMLFKNNLLPMEKQKSETETIFDKWRGDNEQVDDVLVIGLRF